MKKPHFIQDPSMEFQKFLLIMQLFIIEKHTAYLLQMAFYLTMSHQEEGLPLLLKKLCKVLVRIKKGLQNKLTLGNLYAIRDWGHAKDYAVQCGKFYNTKNLMIGLIATNKDQTVKKFIEIVAKN